MMSFHCKIIVFIERHNFLIKKAMFKECAFFNVKAFIFDQWMMVILQWNIIIFHEESWLFNEKSCFIKNRHFSMNNYVFSVNMFKMIVVWKIVGFTFEPAAIANNNFQAPTVLNHLLGLTNSRRAIGANELTITGPERGGGSPYGFP